MVRCKKCGIRIFKAKDGQWAHQHMSRLKRALQRLRGVPEHKATPLG